MKKWDYVLATKYSDGDPLDAWAVGYFVGMLPKDGGDRYEVGDVNGNLFRGNGYRRAMKINRARGEWLLLNVERIEQSGRSVWEWKRAPMTSNAKVTGAAPLSEEAKP